MEVSEGRVPDELHDTTAAIRAAGAPGVHLSVRVVGGPRFDVCEGVARRGPVSSAGSDGGDDDALSTPRPVPLTPQHAHDLGSVTKVAGTTSAIAALLSAGQLALDSRVGMFIDGLAPSLADGTVRDLLQHRAGLWEWWPTYLEDRDPIDTIRSLPLRYAPGSGRHYSDLGFMLLGRIIEVATSLPLTEAHRQFVAGPIGSDCLTYAAPPAGHPATASSYGDAIEYRMVTSGDPYPVTADPGRFAGWRRHVLLGEVNDGNAFHSFAGAAGHAGLFGTVDALHTLGEALLTSLAEHAPWAALVDIMAPGPDAGQRCGFRSWETSVDGCSVEMLGHTGFPGVGFGIMPAHDASVVLMTNRLHTRGTPIRFEPWWQRAMTSAHRALHTAGMSPRGTHDAGTRDAGTPGTGTHDAGTHDAGTPGTGTYDREARY